MTTETYIGDAVYASFDGYQIKLRCAAPECEIYLDPIVLANLITFAINCRIISGMPKLKETT